MPVASDRPGSGPTKPWRFLQVPRRIHTFLPSSSPSSFLVELEGFPAGRPASVSGPAKPIWVMIWSRMSGSRSGEFRTFEDRLDAAALR